MPVERMEQILRIDPPVELVFRGSYAEVCKTTLRLSNPSDKRVLFKVKTTAPKSYCVRPNSGIIAQGASQEVDVMLQSGEISDQDRSKHKFMVQTMFAPSNEETFSDAVWKDVTKDKLMDTRLKCVFIEEPPSEGYRPEPLSTPSVEPSSLTPIVEDKLIEPTSAEPAPVPPPQTNAGSTPTSAPPPAKDDPESTRKTVTVRMYEDKVEKLSSENSQLKAELNQLRLRKPAPSMAMKTTPTPVVTTQGPTITPIVIAIIVIAIIMGYIVGKFF